MTISDWFLCPQLKFMQHHSLHVVEDLPFGTWSWPKVGVRRAPNLLFFHVGNDSACVWIYHLQRERENTGRRAITPHVDVSEAWMRVEVKG